MTDKPTNPLFGRKWKVLVLDPSGNEAWSVSDSDWSNEALRCTFRIEQVGYQSLWYSDITIWNLAGDTTAEIVNNTRKGFSVIVEAGYQSGSYGKVFDGTVFQPLFDRENVTDFILTLRCIDGMGLLTSNLCKMTLEAGYDYAGVIAKMASSARTPIPVERISTGLESKKMPRGKVIFGEPRKYLRQMTQDSNCQWWVGDGKLNVSSIDDAYEEQAVVFTPETGLVGTPQQTQNGVIFRVLLSPQITVRYPPMAVKLENTTIRQAKVNLGQVVSPLDQDGFYKVARVVHHGDTRGNDWYTEVTGVNLVGNVSALLGMYTN